MYVKIYGVAGSNNTHWLIDWENDLPDNWQ